MTLMIQITLAAALILSILVPFGAFFLGEKNKKRYKRSLACNCFFFFGSLLIGTIVMFGGTVAHRRLLRLIRLVLQQVLAIWVLLW